MGNLVIQHFSTPAQAAGPRAALLTSPRASSLQGTGETAAIAILPLGLLGREARTVSSMTGECELMIRRRRYSNIFSAESLTGWLSFPVTVARVLLIPVQSNMKGDLTCRTPDTAGMGCPFALL